MLRRRLSRWFIWLVVAACGCGGVTRAGASLAEDPDGSTDADGSSNEASIPDACTQFATVRCATLFRCMPMTAAVVYPNEEQCAVQVGAACQAELASPGVSFVGQDKVACELARASLPCFELLLSWSYDQPHVTACDLPPGTASNGEICFFDSACASGQCAHDDGLPWTCGSCQDGLPLGASCLYSIRECAPGTQCLPVSGSASESRCTAVARTGESCDAKPCWDRAPCTAGVCPQPALGKQGAPCTAGPASLQCLFDPQCYWDYYCDAASNTCQPFPPLAAEGEPCDDTFCAGGAACMPDGCSTPAAWDSPCSYDNCVLPAACIDGICRLPYVDRCGQ